MRDCLVEVCDPETLAQFGPLKFTTDTPIMIFFICYLALLGWICIKAGKNHR